MSKKFMHLLLILGCSLLVQSAAALAQPHLSPRNTEAPFCYVPGGTRSWPVLESDLPVGSRLSFVARRDDAILAEGERLNILGLSVLVAPVEFTLVVSLHLPDGAAETQQLTIRPAPPRRPISYLADFGDDIIRIFMDSHDGHWRPITKSGFDQYFRRCQAHGVHRLILWQMPFPFICDPDNYATEDWDRYEKQTRAMLDSELLSSLIATRKEQGLRDKNWGLLVDWEWYKKICELRLHSGLGAMVSESASEHGVALTASFRPFETALTKYCELPTFDHRGEFLWGFLPFATPVVNYHPDETCFSHFRTVLREMGQEDAGRVGAIEICGVENADAFLERFERSRDNLRIVASNFVPLQEESLVMQRNLDGGFKLRPFGEIKQQAEEQQTVLSNYRVEKHGDSVRIVDLQAPADMRYLILSNPTTAEEAIDLPTDVPVQLFAKAGNRLSRGNVYWALDESLDPDGLTNVAGIPTTGSFHSEFNATRKSQDLTLQGPERLLMKQHQLVIDLGAPWSVEMLDLNRPAMRANVVKEMATVLKLPAFDELFVNTRSHVDLANSMADGEEGILPLVQYRRGGKRILKWLGIDLAYAPIAAAQDDVLQSWATDLESVERVTTWQLNEWFDQCQSASSPFRWRYVRNREVAAGVRLLLKDLEQAFPGTRTRIVLPLREKAVLAVKDELEAMLDADGKPYGRDYSRVWSTINYIPVIGEGMAMVDLNGLSTEPVLFGVRGLPDLEPFQLFLRHSLEDLADNHGSAFRGPRSFFFEAQESLRMSDQEEARRRRAEIICECLAHSDEINEVILYEAADWLYFLPMAQPDICSHAFVEDYLPGPTAETDPGNSGQSQ